MPTKAASAPARLGPALLRKTTAGTHSILVLCHPRLSAVFCIIPQVTTRTIPSASDAATRSHTPLPLKSRHSPLRRARANNAHKQARQAGRQQMPYYVEGVQIKRENFFFSESPRRLLPVTLGGARRSTQQSAPGPNKWGLRG